MFALEQTRVDIARKRWRWRTWLRGIDPNRLVFIDETWIKTNMAPIRGWGPKGARLRGFVPHGHWRTLTFLGALRSHGLTAPCVFDGPINGLCFRAYVEQQLLQTLIPAKKEPIRSRVPLRRFRYDARHDILKCPKGRVLRPQRPIEHGRFVYSRSKDCRHCPMRGDCLSPGRVNKAVVVSDDHPALLRARRRKERWSKEDARLYRRHRWRSEGFHGETKAWHGLARAVRRGMQHMRIQAFLTAAAINLKRLAAALLAKLLAWRTAGSTSLVV